MTMQGVLDMANNRHIAEQVNGNGHSGIPPQDAGSVLAADIVTLTGSLDVGMWALAERVARAKAEMVPNWAEIAGRAAGRSPRTVREWAQVAELRAALVGAPEMKYSYYAEALAFIERLPAETIVELMQVARDEDASADQYAAELRNLCGKPDTDYPKQWAGWSVDLLGQVDSYEPPVSGLLRRAALALSEAATEAKKA